MRNLPAGWATDLAILELSGSTADRYADHIVVRSPENPDYHWGNCLLVTDPERVDDANHWADRFAEAHPTATWLSIGLPAMPGKANAWERIGAELESIDVLTTGEVPQQAERPDGYTVRSFAPQDWDTIARLDMAENAQTGRHDPEIHARFIQERNAIRADLCKRGVAEWFGAFDERGELAASLGIVRCGATARYQDVMTQAEHRRRGLASHLLGVAAQWTAKQGCTEWVIVTESTNDAGRVYRRAGFELDVAYVQAYRLPAR